MNLRAMYTPVYTITNKILKNIGIIEASKEVIDHAPLLPFYEKKFRNEAMVRAVHYGTHIEGNELNLNQAEKVMFGETIVARERDVQEVINYRKAMEFISQLQQSRRSVGENKYHLEEEIIRKIHRITTDRLLAVERAGEFRGTQVVVRNSATGEITFTPPPPGDVPIKISDLLQFINITPEQDIHPVLKSGVVHYEFVRIHPFVDGNGRVGRALSTLILFLEGYDIRKFFSLEEYFDSDAYAYYDSLQSVARNNGDLTGWLEYFTQGLAIELSKIKERIEKISVDAKLKQKLGGQPVLLSERQLAIIEYIQKTGFLQNSGFKQLFPFISEDTVLNDLKALMKDGIIRKQGKTKAARYVMI